MKNKDDSHESAKESEPGNIGDPPSQDAQITPRNHGGRRKGAGAKPLEFDLVLVRKLSRIQCTDEEIAACLQVSPRTIQRHKKRREFREAMEVGKAEGRVSVRRQLFKLSEGGNVAATIFLSKNLLGYKNTVEVQTSDASPDDAKKAMDDLRALYGLNCEPSSPPQIDDSIKGDL